MAQLTTRTESAASDIASSPIRPGTLLGKVALVTGGSRGIGAAIARRLAAAGADVALTYARGADKAQAIAAGIEQTGRRARALAADQTDPAAVSRAVDDTLAAFGRLDILVNNAGIYIGKPFDQYTVDDYVQTMDVNVPPPARGRAHHHHQQQPRRTSARADADALLDEQVRADRLHQGPGARPRAARYHRQCRAAGRDRDGHESD
jgi:NAD(P)-dependent dehydrogenase (short-subunit alcohol dehydrogenase family)